MDEAAQEATALALGGAWAVVAAIACGAIVVAAVISRRHLGPSSVAWTVPFIAAPAFFAVWCTRGLCQIGALEFCFYQVLCAVFGIVVLQRGKLAELVERPCASADGMLGRMLAAVFPWVRDLALIAIAAWLSFVAMEMADNPNWQLIETRLFMRGFELVALAMAALYFLGQRRGALCAVVTAACVIFGLVQNFLNLFKNTALLPSDVLAWKTAAAVSGGYTYMLPAPAIACIVCGMAALAALALIVPQRRHEHCGPRGISEQGTTRSAGQGRKLLRPAVNLVCCAACACGVWYGATGSDYQEALNVKLDYWDLRNSYHESGFLVSFIAAAQDLVIDEPPGYSDETARQLQEVLARRYDDELASRRSDAEQTFATQMPSVIAIMNESYADLSIFQQLHDGYAGTFVTRDLEDALISGWLNMSVHGGGTCNSEYEFLAQSSMQFMGSGMYPYQQFSFAKLATLPATFKEMGYRTWAMHPSYPGNWSREFVYASMGLDTSLFVYDFEGADQFHGLVSDRATYDRALQILRDNDGAQFIVDITMQNHGGYDTGTISADQLTDVKPDFLDVQQTAVLNEYLSCIQASDEAIAYLLDELGKLSEPVAVVFFGDHQPSFSRDYNDALFADENELVHKARISITPYFIWTNYDTETPKQADVESSANFLGAQLLEAIGAPLSDYQKALLVLHENVTAVNTSGYRDKGGIWHEASDAADPGDPFCQLRMLHYLNVVRNL